jgi:hypothetical protein
MKHHKEEEKVSYDFIYYLIGLISGLFVGVVIDHGLGWVLILGLFGLMFAGFFVNLLVRGREQA